MIRVVKIAVVVLACCFILQWWACGLGPEGNPLPPLSTIDSIDATIDVPRTHVSFSVPANLWSELYQALQPARRDGSPAKWQSLGRLELNLEDGKRMQAFLFQVSDGAGAFALGEDWEKRVYYRGGSSANLKAVLQSAQSGVQPATATVDPG